MKFCQHCGAEIHDEAVICVKCGCSVETVQPKSNSSSSLLNIAKVFMIISCVLLPVIGLFYGLAMMTVSTLATTVANSLFVIYGIMLMIGCLVPLAWMIPMTVHLNKKIKNDEPIGIAFKICTLLFVSKIAGILLLCHSDSN